MNETENLQILCPPPGVAGFETFLSGRVWTFGDSLKAGVLPAFVRLVTELPSLRATIVSLASTSAGQLTINQEGIGALALSLPPPKDQEEIVQTYEDEIGKAAMLEIPAEAELAAINAFPGALLRRAFSGQL